MRKILVTGSTGQLGTAINGEYEKDNVTIVNTDVKESPGIRALDITSMDAVMTAVSDIKPDVIINCAAHTNVELCESQWDLAYKINAIGPRNLSVAADRVNAKIIHVSTDYVFDGKNREHPYVEFDKTGPTSAYGKTKLEGENFVKNFSNRCMIVRTAWLYGELKEHSGKNFVKTMLKLAENNKEVSVVKDQVGTPTSAKELARMIHHIEPTENYGLFHGTCEGDCSWAEFAEEIFRLGKKDVRVMPISSEEYKTVVKRPSYSILENYMLRLTTNYEMAQWQDALKEYMLEINN